MDRGTGTTGRIPSFRAASIARWDSQFPQPLRYSFAKASV